MDSRLIPVMALEKQTGYQKTLLSEILDHGRIASSQKKMIAYGRMTLAFWISGRLAHGIHDFVRHHDYGRRAAMSNLEGVEMLSNLLVVDVDVQTWGDPNSCSRRLNHDL